MKIVIVPSWYNSDRASTRGSFVKEQALAISRRGLDVTVVVFDRDASMPLLQVRHSVEAGLKHIRIAVPEPWHRLLGFYAPQPLARRLEAVLKKEAPDLVHAHAVRPAGIIAGLALANYDIPWCLTEHSSPLRAFWWTTHGRNQIGHAYRSADRLFSVSNRLLDEMKGFFPHEAEHATLLYNGIDTERFRPHRSRDLKSYMRFLFVGGLINQKGVDVLFYALSILPPDIEWSLSVIGVGPLERKLREQAASIGIDDRIYWLGAVPRDAMPNIYCNHDLLVVSSNSETFSLVSAEALACGVPVVATKCGGPEEVIGPLGLPLVPPGDPTALSEAIRGILGRLSEFDREGAAKSIERRFSMTTLAARLETIYADMVGGAK